MTKTEIKGKRKKTKTKKRILIILGTVFAALSIFWAYSKLTRHPDLSDLDPEDYRDNPELYEFAKGLHDAKDVYEKDDFLSDFYENSEYPSSLKNDKRFIDILTLCLYERETTSQKFMYFFSEYMDDFSISDLSDIADYWDDFIYCMKEDAKSGLRSEALGKLAKLEEKAYPALPEFYRLMYEDPVVDVRDSVVWNLMGIRPPQAFPYLMKLIGDKEMRNDTLGCALGGTAKKKESIYQLISLLDSDKERIKKIGLEALRYIEPDYLDKTLNEKLSKKIEILIDDPSPEVRIACIGVLKSLKDDKKNERLFSNILLEKLGKTLINDPSPEVRIYCVSFFCTLTEKEKSGNDKIIDWVCKTLINDPSPEVRLKCIGLFDHLPRNEKNSNDKLYEIMSKVLMSDSETEVRIQCLDYFDGVRSSKTFGILLEALKEEKSTAVKIEFIETLGSYRNSFDILKEFILEENEVEIKLAAIRKMGKLYWGSGNTTKRRIADFLLLLTKNPSTIDVVRDKCLEKLSFMHKEDSEQLIIDMIKGRYKNRIFTRKEIDVICSTRGDKRAEIIVLLLEILNEQISGKDSFMATEDICYLIEKLSSYSFKEDKDKIKKMLLKLFDKVPEKQSIMRDALILELAEFKHQESIEHLINKLVKEKNDNEKLILSHVGNWKSKDLSEYLLERLKESRENSLLLLIFKSCNLDDARVINRILEIIYDESFDEYTRIRAIQGLWRTKTTLALEGVRKLVNDSELSLIMRLEAVDGFKTTEFKKYLTFVAECLRHENTKIRKRAVQALWIRLDRDILLLFKERVKEEEDKELKKSIEYIISRLENDYHI